MTLAVLVALLVGGCAAIPSSGPVVAGPPVEGDSDGGLRFQPVTPQRDALPHAVVRGFLLAASGAEDDHAFARAYLGPSTAEEWRPGAGATVFADGSAELTLTQAGQPLASDVRPELLDGPVSATLTMTVVARVDANGRFTPAPPGTRDRVEYVVEPSGGEWRITSLPDGLVVDEAGFDLAFSPYQLYWVDRSAQFLVPETRWFAERRSIATSLVTELLRGPSPWLAAAVRTGFPPATTLTRPPAVPVLDGEAQVDLTGMAQQASSEDRSLMQAQLQATLQPVASVSTVRMTVEGGELVLPAGRPQLVRNPGVEPVAVAVSGSGLVEVTPSGVGEVTGLPPLDGLGVSHPARGPASYAVLAADRTRLLHLVPGTEAEPEVLLAGASRLTAPSIDPTGWIWATARPSSGTVTAVRPGSGAVDVAAGWLDGRHVESLRVSRDGVRALVVSVGPDGEDHRLDLAAVVRRGDGRPVELTRSSGTSSTPGLVDITEAVWTGEASAAVLGRRADDARPRVLLAQPLDGFLIPLGEVPGEAVVVALAAGSGERSILAATADGRLWQRAGTQWIEVPSETPLTDPAFGG